jgi:superfamily II DNA or RNA helicase
MITLRDYQLPAVDAMLRTKRAICQAPAGSGKTVIASATLAKWVTPRARLARRRMRIAWIANTQEQCDQATKALGTFPAIAGAADVTVCCFAAGISLETYDLVIIDECHHIAAAEFRKIMDQAPAWRWGFSATPHRADELAKDVFELIGPIVHIVERKALVQAGQLAKARVIIHEPNRANEFEEEIKDHAESLFKRWRFGAQAAANDMAIRTIKSLTSRTQAIDKPKLYAIIQEAGMTQDNAFIGIFSKFPKGHPTRSILWKMLIQLAEEEIEQRARWIACQKIGIFDNKKRNAQIIQIARQHANDSHLIIIGSIDHGAALQERIPGSLVVHSKLGTKKRRQAIEDFSKGELKTMIATSLADEGLDVPRANVLTLAAAGRSAAKAEQRTGRVLRSFHDKTHGTIHDFMDTSHPMLLSQSKKRISLYRSLGYDIQTATKEGGLI